MTMSMGSLEEQLRPQLLSGLAYERLLAEIISGRLAPGQRLRLDLLAHSWAVSRTPVREALTRLSDMRFVHVSPNAGTRVADWSCVDMIERVRVIDRLIVKESLTGSRAESLSGALATRTPLTDTDCELTWYLDLAEALICREFGRLGPLIVGDHIDPLRLFVDPDTARRHGVDVDSGRPRRRALLASVRAALAQGGHDAASETLDAFGASFLEMLGAPPAASPRRGAASEPPLR
ncbi:GntR family transcriptional regulator [Microbacterium sp. CGR1]|uniref:GntR family transcriptional regulator n=1 Tax=Microbacterium sp. CGR1 TaxID=1696072 RepID=UPI003DA257AB